MWRNLKILHIWHVCEYRHKCKQIISKHDVFVLGSITKKGYGDKCKPCLQSWLLSFTFLNFQLVISHQFARALKTYSPQISCNQNDVYMQDLTLVWSSHNLMISTYLTLVATASTGGSVKISSESNFLTTFTHSV